MVAPDDTEPQRSVPAPAEDHRPEPTPAPEPPTPQAPGDALRAVADPPAEAPAPEGPSGDADASAPSAAPVEVAPAEDAGTPAEVDQQQVDGSEQADGSEDQPKGEGRRGKRRPRRRRQQFQGPRRFAWDEIFLRQRLELLRAMDPDPEAIAWAVDAAGRFVVADILAGEGSSGREFGRRAYRAEPETDDQAAWIILAAVRARDILPIARTAVAGTSDQREQVRAAAERLGVARVNTALQGDRPTQQVFAERARRVDVSGEGGEDQKAAWALLSLARTQDVRSAMAPPRDQRPDRGRRGPGGDARRERRRREPGIPGGVYSLGESGIGGELGAKLRAALAQAEAAQAPEPEPQAEAPEAEAPAPVAEPTAEPAPESQVEAPEAETPVAEPTPEPAPDAPEADADAPSADGEQA